MAVRKPRSKIALACLSCLLSSCAVSLGKFDSKSDYNDYYDAIDDVTALYDGGEDTYSIEDSLFNDETVQNFSWEDEDDVVKQRQYLYIIIPFKEALTIEALVLYAMTPENVTMKVSLFYFEPGGPLPSEPKYLTSPDDEDPNYDDPLVGDSIVNGDVEFVRDEWQSIGFGYFAKQGYEDQKLHVQEDGKVYIRIENNSGWNKLTLTPITFTFINLIVRAI